MNTNCRWIEGNGVRALAFPALEWAGVRALFSARHGGVSPPPTDSLNWSYFVGDEPERVAVNRARTLSLLGLTPARTAVAGLVHGNRVVRVDDPAVGRGLRDSLGFVPDTDGLVTDRPGIGLVVTAADCVPLFVADPGRPALAVGHAGWRGTAAGLAAALVAALVAEYGADPARLVAVVGPAIGPCCYEVDEPVAGPVRARFALHWRDLLLPGRAPGKWQLDLWAANARELAAAGLDPGHIHVTGVCTACSRGDFFSHRGDAGRSGRAAAVARLT